MIDVDTRVREAALDPHDGPEVRDPGVADPTSPGRGSDVADHVHHDVDAAELEPGPRCSGDTPPRVEVLSGLPTFEDVDARRIQRIGGDRQVEAARCLPSSADEVLVGCHITVA